MRRKATLLALLVCSLTMLILAGVWARGNGVPRETMLRGTPGADVLLGGPGNEIIVDSYIPDRTSDLLHGGAGDDVLDAVSDPPLEDTVRCGAGEDLAQVDPEDDVGGGCEEVDVIDLSKDPRPPEGEPKYMPAPGERANETVEVVVSEQ